MLFDHEKPKARMDQNGDMTKQQVGALGAARPAAVLPALQFLLLRLTSP